MYHTLKIGAALICSLFIFLESSHADDSESIRRGKLYLEQTYGQLPKNVGVKMNCTSCHMGGGMVPGAASWIGVTHRYPQYRARIAKTETLAERINDCFERSMNGKPLPLHSQEMKDMLNYMSSISKDKKNSASKNEGIQLLTLKQAPDLKKGADVYQNQCAVCHQSNGQGVLDGKIVIYPPLWGNDSFNIGAGMARLYTAAGFVKAKMPLGQGGSLSDEDAWNVAAYFTQQPRPDFKGKEKDWPKGGKPKDARY